MSFTSVIPKNDPFVPIYPENYPADNMKQFLVIQGHKFTCRLDYPYFYKLQKKSRTKVVWKCRRSDCKVEIKEFEAMIKHWSDAHQVCLVKHGHYCPLCQTAIKFGLQSFNNHARYDCVRTAKQRETLEEIENDDL